MNFINEHDQIRVSLSRIRKLREQAGDEFNDSENFKRGEKVTFNNINSSGFLINGEDLTEETKNEVVSAIEEFIKATNVITDNIAIEIGANSLVVTLESVDNPGVDVIEKIIFDTDNSNPKVKMISGTMDLTEQFTTLMASLVSSYSNNQLGRNRLVSALNMG